MKKINFNDRYGLTQAVIEGRKTMTRRIMIPQPDFLSDNFGWAKRNNGDVILPKYGVYEIVAVAQRYSTIAAGHPDVDTFLLQVAKAHKISLGSVHDLAGWNNKMFTKAELMPHQIRITGIKCERLQDISDEDCIKEGIFVNEYVGNGKKCHHYGFDGFFDETAGWFARGWYNTPRKAFATLIDKVSGRGTWGLNPWVVVYEFELVK